MKKVFALIEKESAKFAQSPFFEFLRNKTIAFIQRFSFALFVMGYGDLNKFVWLEEATVNPIQYSGSHSDAVQDIARCRGTAVPCPYGCVSRKREPLYLYIVNKQIREEENHWIWFLKDLEYLDFKLFLNFRDSLKFHWSAQTVILRQRIYELYRRTFQVNPIYKLVAIESIESILNIFLSITALVTQELKVLTNREYRYFGNTHLLAKNDHSVNSYETKEFIATMHLAEDIRKQACKLVNKIFELFTALVDMLVNFAEEYNIKQLLTRSFDGSDFAQLPCGKKATVGV